MPTRLDRRQFLVSSSAMVASAAIASSAVADDVDQLPIVDTHHHLWDLGKFRLPWQKDKPTLARNFVMSDYLAAVRGKNVVKTVYMEVDVEVSQQSAEIEYVSAICREGKSPMVAAVVSGRPASDEFSQYVAKHRENPYLRGIRQVLHNPEMPAGFCLDPKFVAGVRLLGSVGWSFDLCMRSTELNDAAKLIDACPDTRFVLDHCGNASLQAKDLSAWRRDIAALAERKNVIGKVSGIIASAPRPGEWTIEGLATIVNHTLAAFGPDRVVFGGDWPVCTLGAELGQWIDALKTIVRDRPATEQRKLFHDNAVKFYRLA